MPPYPKQPITDFLNPCYCPALPARAYIHNLHQDLVTTSNASGFPPLTRRAVNNPFTRLLAQSLSTPGAGPGDKGVLDSDSDTSFTSTSTSSSASTTVSSNSSSSSSRSSSCSSGDESTSSLQSSTEENIPGSGSREEQIHSISSHPRASTTGDKNIAEPRSHAATLRTQVVTSSTITNDIATTVTLDSSHMNNPLFWRFNGLRDSRLLARPLRKRKELHQNTAGVGSDDDSDDDDDLRGPPKQMKSILGSGQRSFEVRLKRETLNFHDLPSSRGGVIPSLEVAKGQDLERGETVAHSPDSFFWLLSPQPQDTARFPAAGAPAANSTTKSSKNSPHTTVHLKEQFLESIKQVAPMIRIPRSVKDPQALARYLGRNGLLTTALMRVLGTSDVQELLLGPSFRDHNGLNIGSPDLLRELHRHGMFNHLIRLSCDNVSLKDDSIVNLHSLPLQGLSLSGTNLTNAAKNPAINDDAIPALIMFKKLELLILEGTHVDMDGLRRLASNVHSENRKLRIEIPLHCRYYLDHMHHYYLLHPAPPLFNTYDREDIWNLQLVELRQNLAAHNAVNRTILTTGNKAELRARLSEVLMKREKDLVVKRVYEDGLVMVTGRDGRLNFGVVEEGGEDECGEDGGGLRS